MNVGEGLSKTFSIPISHLDYEYIKNCNNIKELEKIYYTLHVGEEGYYPDLLKFCENRLKKLSPNSSVLCKPEAIKSTAQLDPDQKRCVTQEIADFIRSSQEVDAQLINECGDGENAKNNIPIRGKTTISSTEQKNNSGSKAFKSCVPKDYKEWSKIEAELDKEIIEESAEQGRPTPSKSTTKCTQDSTIINTINKGINSKIDTTGMTDLEKERKALSAKDKGNEAFRSGDYDEAISYYSQSLSVIPSPTVYNNRGMAYMKLKKWKEGYKDLTKTLKSEPENIKALLRRSSCNYELHNLEECIRDCQKLLSLEPDNKTTTSLLEKANDELQRRNVPRLKGGKRMVITEVDSDDEDEDEENDDDAKHEEIPKKETINIKDQPLTIEEIHDSETPTMTYSEVKEKGNELFKRTKFKESLEYYNKLTKMEPHNPVGYRNRAIAHLNLKNFKDVIKDCDMALKFDSTSSLAYFRRGKGYKGLENYEECMKDFEKALSYTTANEFVVQIQQEIDDTKMLIHNKMTEESKEEIIEVTEKSVSEDKKEDEKEDNWELVEHQQTIPSPTPAAEDNEIPETIQPAIPVGEITPFQFEKRISDIRMLTHSQASLTKYKNMWRCVIQLLVDTGAENLVKMIGNKADADSLRAIITGLEVYSRNKDHRHFVMDILSQLVQLPRFGFLKLMIPDSSIEEFEKIFKRLNEFDIDSRFSAKLKDLHMNIVKN